MRTLLLIMNPRRIPECVASLEALPVDQAWLTAYPEQELPINRVVAETCYDRYSIISDDAIVSAPALAAVLAAHTATPEAIVTGYSPLAMGDERVNLVSRPLEGDVGRSAEGLLTLADVAAQPAVFETWFAGYAFTTASRAAWLECPHPQLWTGNDYHQSRLFARSGRRILAVRAGRVEHVKEIWNHGDQDPRKQSWVGLIPPEVRWRFAA